MTLHARMTSITGLVRMAWIQSKFSNIGSCSFPWDDGKAKRPGRRPRPGSALAGPALELRHPIGRDGDQLLVRRVLHDVPVGRHGPRVLLARLVERGAARHRGEAPGVVAVRGGERDLVGAKRAGGVPRRLAGPAQAVRRLDLERGCGL